LFEVSAHQRIATRWEIVRGLHSVLDRLVADPARWVLILVTASSRNRYVQFLAPEDGGLVAECVSNINLAHDEQLEATDEGRLVALGWSCPLPPRRPNFYTHQPPGEENTAIVASRVATTLEEVFGVDARDLLVVKMFRCDPPLLAGRT